MYLRIFPVHLSGMSRGPVVVQGIPWRFLSQLSMWHQLIYSPHCVCIVRIVFPFMHYFAFIDTEFHLMFLSPSLLPSTVKVGCTVMVGSLMRESESPAMKQALILTFILVLGII